MRKNKIKKEAGNVKEDKKDYLQKELKERLHKYIQGNFVQDKKTFCSYLSGLFRKKSKNPVIREIFPERQFMMISVIRLKEKKMGYICFCQNSRKM